MQKILCIQHRQLGDVLMCTPSLIILRKNFPKAKIHFLTEKLGEQALRYNLNIDKIIIVNRKQKPAEFIKFIKQIRTEKYDLVIDFFSNPKSAYITLLSGAEIRCGFANWSRNWAFTRRLKYLEDFGLEYAAYTKARLLGLINLEFDSIPPIEMTSSITEKKFADLFWRDLGVNADDRVIAMCPVSRRDYKIWPAENYAYIADKLIDETAIKVFIVYGPGEQEQAELVSGLMKNKAIVHYPMPDINQLRAILERCLLFTGNDGGNKHIAISAGIPTVTIFRQLNPQNWTPPDTTFHIAFSEGQDGNNPIGSIKKEEVFKALINLIKSN